MSSLLADQRERFAFIERSMHEAAVTLQHPAVIANLGHSSVDAFVNALENAVPLETPDGTVRLPSDHLEGSLPVVATRPGEALTFDTSCMVQTARQEQATRRQLHRWGIARDGIDNIYDVLSEKFTGGLSAGSYTLPSTMNAFTGSLVFRLSRETLDVFPKPPEKGVAIVRMQPVLVLKMLPERLHAAQEEVAHELTHREQYEEDPVLVVHSQRSADMQMLRQELEAYHVGAVVSLLSGLDLERVQRGNTAFSMAHMVVDSIRLAHNRPPLDPFQPSPLLLKKLHAAGLPNILHGGVNYEALVADKEQPVSDN